MAPAGRLQHHADARKTAKHRTNKHPVGAFAKTHLFNDHKERNEKRHGVKERLSRADLQMLYGHDVDQQSEHAAYRSADMRLRDLCFERRLRRRRHQNGKESHVAGTDEENVPNFVLRRHPLHEHIGEHRKKSGRKNP